MNLYQPHMFIYIWKKERDSSTTNVSAYANPEVLDSSSTGDIGLLRFQWLRTGFLLGDDKQGCDDGLTLPECQNDATNLARRSLYNRLLLLLHGRNG